MYTINYYTFKRRFHTMKKIKTLLIITFCFTFVIMTTNLNEIHEIQPLNHHHTDTGKK